MERHTIVGIGELLWDCFGDDRRPGGAPANVAFHAGQLGMTGRVVTRVGRDEAGDGLVGRLEAYGLSAQGIQRDDDHPTGWVTVDTTRSDGPAYTIHEDVAWDYLALDDSLTAAVDGAAAICFGTLAQRCPTSRATIQRVLDRVSGQRAGALRVYDVNLRPPWYSREVIEASLRRCDVVKLNHEEIPVVARLLGLGVTEIDAAARALRERFGLRLVCVTRGERGSALHAADEVADAPGRPVEVADTVGAGDAFTAAMVCGLLWGWTLPDVAEFANSVGAIVAGRHGAMPDVTDEVKRLGIGK